MLRLPLKHLRVLLKGKAHLIGNFFFGLGIERLGFLRLSFFWFFAHGGSIQLKWPGAIPLKIMHQPGGLYLGCRQIAMDPEANLPLDANLSSIHSLFFDESLYIDQIEILRQQMSQAPHPQYFKTQGVLVPQIVTMIQPHDFVELVFKSENASVFLQVLNLLKAHPQKFMVYALSQGLTRTDFESTLNQISKVAKDLPLVLQPDTDFVGVFAYQQCAQHYFPEVRVIPQVTFEISTNRPID
jgi:hypothetical protein